MTLLETLNKIGIVGDAMSITFTAPDGEDDIDAGLARHLVSDYLIEGFMLIEADSRDEPDAERAKQLCIYGAKLFDAIDNHDADPSGHDLNG